MLKLKYIRITIFYQYHAQNNTSNNIPLGVFIKIFSFLLFIWWLIRLKHIQLYFFIRWDYAHFLKIFIFAVPGRCSDGLNYLIDIWLFFWTNENAFVKYILRTYIFSLVVFNIVNIFPILIYLKNKYFLLYIHCACFICICSLRQGFTGFHGLSVTAKWRSKWVLFSFLAKFCFLLALMT